MNLSDYIQRMEIEIKKLKDIYSEHGNLRVLEDDPYGAGVREPYEFNSKIAYLKILSKRERVEKFWSAWAGKEKGEKVLRV